MSKKVEKVIVEGVSLTPNEKKVFDLIQTLGKGTANDLVDSVGESVASVRSTLARLEKTHGLIKKSTVLQNEKAVAIYLKK